MSSSTATINDRTIDVAAGETLLQAALRAGLPFPHACRVGGCASCKCRLAQGEVRALTETAYLLSAEEIADGAILACQSLPRGDVRIEVALDAPTPRRISATLVERTRLTDDIVRLCVQLDAPLAYRAGQFAYLAFDDLPGVTRSYSFAAPARDDGRVEFFVRHVPGGRFSAHADAAAQPGARLSVDGPHGRFWLRDGDGPLLLVAGGSGLAPILALLEDAATRGVARPVTLLFAARRRDDLYALDRIAALARTWPADFRFVPVLSREADDSDWQGARGRVDAHIDAAMTRGAQAYLCGAPALVDAAAERLSALGVVPADIHADRFTFVGDTPAAATADAGLWHYLKFFGFHAIGLFSAAALFAGAPWTAWGLAAVLAFYIVGDAVAGDDRSTPHYRHPRILTVQLWLALPLLLLIVFAAVWTASAGDPLGAGAFLSALTGHDLLAARDAGGIGHLLAAGALTGLMIGMVGTITAHELTHRTWDPVSMAVGRWLLAFSFDTAFAIEHVYGHHRYVSTRHDPATAPRGRSVYLHILLSTLRGNLSAWRIERARLGKRGHGVLHWRNAMLRGQAMSLVLLAAAFALGGWPGALFFAACALWGKALLEIVNYMEHYGMVRDPATPVAPRHSWNSNRRISSWTLFNLTRHSHHHAQGEVAYQDLRPMPEAPMMLSGYLTTIVITLVPPLWHGLMAPKLLAWDRQHASAAERALAAEANARSGLRALRAAEASR